MQPIFFIKIALAEQTDLHWTGMMLCQMTLGHAKQLFNSALQWMSTSRAERKKKARL